MKAPRFLLIGISGVYNYGCEAIVRGTEILIREFFKDAKIYYASLRVEDDVQRLNDVTINIIPRLRRGKYSTINVIRKLLSLARIHWMPNMDIMSMTDGKDIVVSIGGDLYTMSSIGGYPKYPKPLMKLGDHVLSQGKKYLLWGASIGPFNSDPKIEKYVKKHLQHISLISARENATIEYLNRIGVTNNVVLCADPAYVVAPEIRAKGTKKDKFTIGLNLSPLSVSHLHCGLEKDVVIKRQIQVLQKIVDELNAQIILLPHVVCNFKESDDDFLYLNKIRDCMPSKYQSHLKIVDTDPGFIGIKKEIQKCDIVIAARMHCAINAISTLVPTILLSYSRKSIGMCQYVYGNHDWTLPLDKFNVVSIIPMINKMYNSKHSLNVFLEKRVKEIRQDARKPLTALKKLVSNS